MDVIDSVKDLVPTSEDATIYEYECNDCGERFESNIGPDFVMIGCESCDSNDVELLGEKTHRQ